MNEASGVLLRVLDILEDSEARYLVWGLTEETWPEDRLIEAISAAAPSHDPYDLLEQLLQHNLVFELDRRWPKEYRTRMAETMRLMAHLRQQFPNRPWQAAPRLVADFRFRHEPRWFPERDLAPDAVAARLRARQLPSAQIEAAQQILGGRKLSAFQLDSTIEVFAAMTGRDRGVVVSAGTGSGKTLAFYLPALTYLATRPASSRGVGVVAIYPRNELLKDQFASALDETRQLRMAGGRPIRIGAFFGNTPNKIMRGRAPNQAWRKTATGWVCPFLTCPAPAGDGRCGGDLVWLFSHYDTAPQRQRERLTCARCGGEVTEDEVILTRKSMRSHPPDLLFTTTEMLNRSLSDGWSMHVFGVGPAAPTRPGLVLLDEVHTYEGSDGAQVAYLLRRWRRLLSRPTTWVGLSATLANADRFFEELCGLAEGTVVTVDPQQEQMKPRGREYQVVLRGDPGQQTMLLSTTIQSLMLLRRVLDPQPTALGAFGSRVFAFCDNLDLVNRLYRQMLSAEGVTETGRRNGVALASLRMSRAAQRSDPVVDWDLRDTDGQQWWLPELLGFDERGLTIGRTSSQDTGVRVGADIVVTTSSLEVGFDDPTVGAVLQHKAPRDVASLLQRRGRAGRVQTQRPWTVVVLSDFGRDRVAYQDYETLLAPALPEKRLPLGNQSVRKMQAAMCLVDWAAYRLDVTTRTGGRSMRKVFIQPDPAHAQLREEVADLLTRVMNGGHERQDLMTFIGSSLRLSAEDVEAVCWEQPRSLLLDAVPTARRRLLSRWAAYEDGEVKPEREEWVNDSPLPEFVPKALFSDLCLPEVAIEPPRDYDQAARESIAVHLALNELAPGKVTMRWAVQRGRGLWIEPVSDGAAVALEEGFARSGRIIAEVPGDHGPLPLVRPLITAPRVPDPAVQPSSNGRLQWQTRWQTPGEAIEVPRPRSGPLVGSVTSVRAYLHTGVGALQTWRYARQTSATVLRRGGARQQLTNSFTWHGQPAAVGYEATVDAQLITVAVPDTLAAFRLDRSPRRLRQLRRDFFVDQLRTRLHALRIDTFLSRTIAEAIVAAAAAAVQDDTDPAQLPTLPAAQWRRLVADLLSEGVIGLDDESDEDDNMAPRHQQLLDALTDGPVAHAITESTSLLRAEPDASWLSWLRTRYVHTMAAAWQAGAQQLCPDFDADLDSVIDVDPVADGPTATFVLSDATIGGGGMIETLTSRISDDPRQFDYLVIAALQPSDLEDVDRSLRHTLDLLTTDPKVADAAHRFRTATEDRLTAWQDLLALLTANGVSPAHVTVTTLASRIFRAKSGPESDVLLRDCLARWEDIEARAGFAIDHRSVCMALAADLDLRAALVNAVPEGASEGDRWAQSVLQGLLWPSAEARRAQSLVASNRFVNEAPMTERTLVLDVLPDSIDDVDVDVDDPQWTRRLTELIAASGRCRLVSGTDDRGRLKRALQHLVTQPIELGWLHVHPHVEATSRRDGFLAVEVSLEESPQ